MKVTILLVEDEAGLRTLLSAELGFEDYTVIPCASGEEALTQFAQHQAEISLIILDWMLPGIDGLGVLRKIRRHYDVPVIMMTARDYVGDKVSGLDAGADDYIVKPFDINELLARVRAVSRRPRQWKSTEIIVLDNTELDLMRCSLKGPSNKCTLSKKESELLEIFMRNRGCLMPRSVLLSRVWGPCAPVEDGNLDNYVHFLRKRLRFVGSRLFIKTARGVGYSMEVKNA